MSKYTNVGKSDVFEFNHNGQDYVMWLWCDDQDQPIKACLAVPQGDFANIVMSSNFYGKPVSEYGGTEAFLRDIHLPKVNEYLLAHSGSDYPLDGKTWEQFNWFYKYGLEYSGGEVSIK